VSLGSPIVVEYNDHMGSDLTVVNAARASFERRVDRWEWLSAIDYINLGPAAGSGWTFEGGAFRRPVKDDRNLIRFLAREKPPHFAPFTHPTLSVYCATPLAIARQLWRSHIGVADGMDPGELVEPAQGLGWSEGSGRYLTKRHEFYGPVRWREQAADKKQGSGGPVSEEVAREADMILGRAVDDAVADYDRLLAIGVAPEQARFVLPQGMMTKWLWTGSLYFFARVYTLRTGKGAQDESGEVAAKIGAIASELFPVSWVALMGDHGKET
jgi:thymidylate synthase (FAD)